MRSDDHVIFSSTKAKQSWYVCSKPFALYWGRLIMLRQLDAGMHPAYDGLAALPFYDDFDLSTVNVLLISQ